MKTIRSQYKDYHSYGSLVHAHYYTLLGLITITLLSGLILTSSTTSATDDSVVDEINITVPISCSLTGTGMNTHNAEIPNGTYRQDIGTTTLKAFCNDNEGFAIYAAGYTGNEIGGTNSNKLVGTSASSNATINTGTATSAGNPDTSNWAMKLTATGDSGDTTGTNALTIDSASNVALPSQAEQGATSLPFSSYHVVPNEYVKVAHKNSATSMDTTGGATLTTTYAAYISKTQPADTYSGQVIYTLVHPSTATAPVEPNQIGVLFHGNGQTFGGGRETNRVVYGDLYSQLYTTTTPEIIETSNLANGEQNGEYSDSEYILETRTYDGAYKIMVEVDYDITGDSIEMIAFDDSWDGDWNNWNDVWASYGWIYSGEDTSGTRTYMINGDTVTFYADSWNTPVTDHNYGFSAKIYPLYIDEQENTTLLPVEYYIGNSPEIVKTSNITNNGVQNEAYANNERVHQIITIPNASGIKVVVRYGITNNSLKLIIAEGGWDEDDEPVGYYTDLNPSDNITDTQTLLFKGNTITIDSTSYGIPEPGYDYGFYAQIYPIYETEQENTRPDNLIHSFGPQIGSYAEPNAWSGNWYIDTDDGRVFFEDETSLIKYIEDNSETLNGTTLDVYAFNYDNINCNPNALTISQVICMQDFASFTDEVKTSILESMVLEKQYTLVDNRDGKLYSLSKLADDNVWMTKNLDLDLDSSRVYTNLDTDIGYNYNTGTYETATWTPIRSTYSSNQIHEWCQGGVWNSEYNNCEQNDTPESYNPGNLYWNGALDHSNEDWSNYNESCEWNNLYSCDETINPLSTHTVSSGASVFQRHLGNYYNWAAALATNDNSSSSYENSTYQSICPAGWSLPKGDTSTILWEEYGYNDRKLQFNEDGISILWKNPFYYVAGGQYFDGILTGIGDTGGFWEFDNNGYTSTSVHFDVIDDRASPYQADNYFRTVGKPIRCVVRMFTTEHSSNQ